MQANPYPLRIDDTIMKKLKEVAKSEGRSVNKQIEYIILKYINENGF